MKNVTFTIFETKVSLFMIDSDTENVNFEIIPSARGRNAYFTTNIVTKLI